MRTIILSDVNRDSDSIIPFGLNIGKHSQTRVDIVHLVDPRSNQGVYSSHADSQSITPGEKLSPREILERDKAGILELLDKLLSKEASRLNYPLKINQEVEVGTVEKDLKQRLKKWPDALIIASSEPDNEFIHDRAELLNLLSSTGNPALLVPPGHPFQKPENFLLMTDFSETWQLAIRGVLKWLRHFNPLIFACAITGEEQYVQKEVESAAWEQLMKQYTDDSITLKTNVIKGKDFAETFHGFVGRNQPDWVVIPRARSKAVMDSLNLPAMFY